MEQVDGDGDPKKETLLCYLYVKWLEIQLLKCKYIFTIIPNRLCITLGTWTWQTHYHK